MYEKFSSLIISLFFNYVIAQSNRTIAENVTVTKRLQMVYPNTCEIENYSYLVSIANIKTFTSACEGTLLADIWVLTSSKCAHLMINPKEYVILAGQSRINRVNLQVSGIRRIISHPNFNAETSANDIALLELVTPIVETAFLSYVKLPLREADFDRIKKFCPVATIIGWNFNLPKCINATVISIKKCMKLYQFQFPNQIICTINEVEKGHAQCYGNLGGPLLCGNYQYGIVSMNCLLHNELMVFTNVQPYTSFIENTIISKCCSVFCFQRHIMWILQLLIYIVYYF